MRNLLDALEMQARALHKTLVFPEGHEPRVLEAVKILVRDGIVRPIVLGDPAAIRIDGVTVIDPPKSEWLEPFARVFADLRAHKGVTLDAARETIQRPPYFATLMVQQGLADGAVGGCSYTTAETVRPALEIIKTRESFHKVSSFFLMMLGERILLFADCAVVVDPTPEELAEIALDTARTARRFGIEPRVAMLSFSTNGSGPHPRSERVREATRIAKAAESDLVLDGEMQVDAALVPEVCARKYPGCRLHGDANVLIFPSLEASNIAYKLVERLAKATAVGPILQGLRKPVNDLSRGCSIQDIVDVSIITALQAQDLV